MYYFRFLNVYVKMSKKISALKRFFFILLLSPAVVLAQKPRVMNNPEYDEKKLHFGFSLGLNVFDFNFKRSSDLVATDSLYADISKLEPGFQVNVVSDLRLGNYWNLRCMPGINFGQRKIVYMKNGMPYNEIRIESNFIEMPLTLKYRARRVNNYAPYLLTGVAGRWDLAARKSYDPEKGIYVRLKPFDVYWEIGFGMDYYLYYFRFSTELKLSLGISDVMVHDLSSTQPQYIRAIDRLTSKLVMLSFHFE